MNSEAKKRMIIYILFCLKRSLMRKKENFISIIMELIWQKKEEDIEMYFHGFIYKDDWIEKENKNLF